MFLKHEYTHFINDIDHPDRAIVFKAYRCSKCHQVHRATYPEPSFMSWIIAALSLVQLDQSHTPSKPCV